MICLSPMGDKRAKKKCFEVQWSDVVEACVRRIFMTL